MHKILITGAAGSIGSILTKELFLQGSNSIVAIDNNESALFNLKYECSEIGEQSELMIEIADIRDKGRLTQLFNKYCFDIIYHCAALKHVPLLQLNIEEAIKTNLLGLLNVLDLAECYNIKKFVFISTDKAINLESAMGLTKKLGEMMVKNYKYKGISVRFGNVWGSRGSVSKIWQHQINKNKPITITDDRMERYFMTIDEAVKLIIKAGKVGKQGEIYILDMGEKKKIIEIAKDMIKKTGKDLKIKFIGIRQGEQLSEDLMTKEEELRCIKKNKFFIIKNV